MSDATKTALRAASLLAVVAALWTGIRARVSWPSPDLALVVDVVAVAVLTLGTFLAVRAFLIPRERSERRLRHLVEQPLAGVYVIQDGRFRFVNRKFAEMSGYTFDELVNEVPVDALIHPGDLEDVRARMKGRLSGAPEDVNHAFRILRKDGVALQVEVWGSGAEWAGRPAVVGLMVDQTPGRAQARQARRAQKLESIGEFTGAVAHDFNNLLTAIITPVQLALADLDPQHPLRAQLEEVEGAASRGAALSRQLLAFSRKQVVQPRPLQLNDIVRRLRPMLERLSGPSVTLRLDLDGDLRTVVVDPTQVEQMLVNLAVNARDAMPDGGSLSISTQNVDPDQDPVRAEDGSRPAGHVRIVVEDTGHGFDAAVRERIFEPYFTTKEHGTGLGLSTVFGIARQFGGFVRVESEPGRGSAFQIYLPTVNRAAEPLERPEGARPIPSGGSERVLVVEDQAAVRQVVVRALTRFGYQVTEAADPTEAMERALELGPALDLVVSDVMLPGSTGPEVVRSMLHRHPDLPVLYISGYADQDAFTGIATDRGWLFLQKPFSVEDLIAHVRMALDRSGPASAGSSGA